MTCSIVLMAFCNFQLRRTLGARKIHTLLWRLCDNSCSNTLLKSPQVLVCLSLLHKSLLIFTTCDLIGNVTKECILILRTRLILLLITTNDFWSMWMKNVAPNTDDCRSHNIKNYWSMTSSLQQWLLDVVNHLWIHMLCPVLMMNT